MTDTAMEVEDGEWVKKGKLGQGGFGQVYLYCNQVNYCLNIYCVPDYQCTCRDSATRIVNTDS